MKPITSNSMMTEEQLEKHLEMIGKTEAPDHLFSRIQARIEKEELPVRRGTVIAILGAFLILIFFNIRVITRTDKSDSDMRMVTEGLHLDNSNELYR